MTRTRLEKQLDSPILGKQRRLYQKTSEVPVAQSLYCRHRFNIFSSSSSPLSVDVISYNGISLSIGVFIPLDVNAQFAMYTSQESQSDLQIRSFSIGSASDFIGIRPIEIRQKLCRIRSKLFRSDGIRSPLSHVGLYAI